MLEARFQVVVVDPTGAWWGLRSSADGKASGYPITILGGEHGDLPLDKGSGALVADLIVDERVNLVLDLMLFSETEKKTFVTDLLERLYLRNRQPMHLVIDEADEFAPQFIPPGVQRCCGAVDRIVRRGGIRGVGVTMITQRSAAINKGILTQVDALICLRTISPQDQKAIEAWIEVHGTKEQKHQMMSDLASLPNGTAYVWAPEWTGVFKKVQIRERKTFNSSATPKVGESIKPPKALAAVDIERLKGKMAAVVERARQDDPKELRRQVADLQKELARQKARPAPAAAAAPKAEVKRVEIPIVKDAQIRRLEQLWQKALSVGVDASRAGEKMSAAGLELVSAAGILHRAIDAATAKPSTPRPPAPPTVGIKSRPSVPAEFTRNQVRAAPLPRRLETPAVLAGSTHSEGDGHDHGKGPDPLAKPAPRNMLKALATRHPVRMTKGQMGTVAGYSRTSSQFGPTINTLKDNGVAEAVDGGLRASPSLFAEGE